jgi:hypothetical protein
MPVLSIIACRMQEDELAYLLSADREIRELLLVDGMQALGLSAKLKGQSRPHLLRDLDSIAMHLRSGKPGKAASSLRQCGGFLADLETSWARIKSR